MKIAHPLIAQILKHYKEISLLGKIKATLDWDLNVNLPQKAAAGRAEQSAYLSQRITDLWLTKSFRRNIEQVAEEKNLTNEEKAIVRNLQLAGKYYFQVPQKLIIEKNEVSSQAFMVWKEAREKNDFKAFLPLLTKLIELDRKIATYIGYKDNPYDVLLDMHEPGLKTAHTQKLFDAIKPALINLVQEVQKHSQDESIEKRYINGKFVYPQDAQKELGLTFMKDAGYDFAAGRLDISPHPFTTTLDQYDVRITSGYKEKDFRFSYTSTVHETGHALYEQAIDSAYADTPLSGGVSYGIHEALSRFWENMVGKNPGFLTSVFPAFKNAFPKAFADMTPDAFVALFHIVKPSFIRIEADEITYSLHIILRFEIEKGLINGTIKPEDAAQVWKDKSQEYFGITPKTDAEGVLQDVHWAYGAFGYFPSYALGNLYGAQLLHTMKQSVQVDADLAKGNLANIHTWLNEHVHRYGSVYMPDALIKKATGEKLNPQYFIDYITEKYRKLFF